MMNITVVRNRARSSGIRRFYVGRPSALGNPYPIEKHGREEAIALFSPLLGAVLADPETELYVPTFGLKRLAAMFGMFVRIVDAARTAPIELGCSCRDDREPQLTWVPCHADDIKASALRWSEYPLVVAGLERLEHTCHARGCGRHVRAEMLMCLRHWFMVPAALRRRVLAAYREGQTNWTRTGILPSNEWHEASTAAIEAVAQKEGSAA